VSTQATSAEATVPQVTVLNGHDSQDTAYLIGDYPYGRLRCQMRVWVDGPPAKGQYKGQYRVMRQTSNPKRGNDWANKPHASGYSTMVILYLDGVDHDGAGTQHVGVHSFGFWGPSPTQDAVIHADGTYAQLTAEQRTAYDFHVKISRKADTTGWARLDTLMAYLAAQLAATGEVPSREDATKAAGYIYDYATAVAVTRHNAGL
jgi:hypothetical protein